MTENASALKLKMLFRGGGGSACVANHYSICSRRVQHDYTTRFYIGVTVKESKTIENAHSYAV